MEGEIIPSTSISVVAPIDESSPQLTQLESAEHIITKRQATPEDENFAQRTHHDAYEDVIKLQFPDTEYEILQPDYFKRTWNPEKYSIILDNESPCGLLWIEHKPDCIFVYELVVSKEFQNEGIGTKVLSDILHEANQSQMPVELDVLKKNKALLLYERSGFKKINTTSNHFRMKYFPTPNIAK
jgi:ribosomal protein S18 acetylase RimI-like enzyme